LEEKKRGKNQFSKPQHLISSHLNLYSFNISNILYDLSFDITIFTTTIENDAFKEGNRIAYFHQCQAATTTKEEDAFDGFPGIERFHGCDIAVGVSEVDTVFGVSWLGMVGVFGVPFGGLCQVIGVFEGDAEEWEGGRGIYGCVPLLFGGL
jgi:hypothetical protein